MGTLEDWFKWTGELSKRGIISIHESSGLPWWATITGMTFGVRLAVFPLRFRAWKNGKFMKLATKHCNEQYAQGLREKSTGSSDRNELFKAAMLQKHAETMKSIGASPWKSLSPLPVSVPLFLSVAAGLRGIDFEGAGLGAIWKDFGEPGGLISAVPVALSNFLYLELSRREQQKNQNKDSGSFIRSKLPFILGHTLNLGSFLILSQVPNGVNLFLFVSSVTGLIESKFILKSRGSGWIDYMILKDFNKRICT